MKKLLAIACLLVGSLFTATSCDDANQTPALPNTPFKLPDGTTAYPQGALATHLDSLERKQNASLLIWPDPLLDWLLSFGARQDTRAPKTAVSVSEYSNFVLIQVEHLPHPDPRKRERRIASFTLLAIEPHVDSTAELLSKMAASVNGEATTVTVEPEIHRPDQSTIDLLADLNPELSDLSALQIRVELLDETYVAGDYQVQIEVEFEDNAGKTYQDRIDAEFRIN